MISSSKGVTGRCQHEHDNVCENVRREEDDDDDFDVEDEEEESDLATLGVTGIETGSTSASSSSSSFKSPSRNRSQGRRIVNNVHCKSIRRISEDEVLREAHHHLDQEMTPSRSRSVALNSSDLSNSNSFIKSDAVVENCVGVDQQKRKLMEGLNLHFRQQQQMKLKESNYNQEDDLKNNQLREEEIEYHNLRRVSRDEASSSDATSNNLFVHPKKHHCLKNNNQGLLLLESSGMNQILQLQKELLAKQRRISCPKEEYHDKPRDGDLEFKRNGNEDLEARLKEGNPDKEWSNHCSSSHVNSFNESRSTSDQSPSKEKGDHSLFQSMESSSQFKSSPKSRSSPVKGPKPDKLPPKPIIVPTHSSTPSSSKSPLTAGSSSIPLIEPLTPNQSRMKMGINSPTTTAKNGVLSITSSLQQQHQNENGSNSKGDADHVFKTNNNSKNEVELDKQVTEGDQDHTRQVKSASRDNYSSCDQTKKSSSKTGNLEKNNDLSDSSNISGFKDEYEDDAIPDTSKLRSKPAAHLLSNNSNSNTRPSSSNSNSNQVKRLSRPKEQPPPPWV